MTIRSLNRRKPNLKRIIQLLKLFLTLLFFNFIIDLHAQEQDSPERPKLGLVLSGGGAKGFAHIGALKVFEEAGLQFDYVGGTSMGSIVGGLYAIGYHPDSMAAMVRAQDWNALMNDRIPRRFVPIEEKRNNDRLIATFPIRGRRVLMRRGLYNGQLIDMLLSRLTSPVYMIQDFSELSLPFVCNATNLVDGSNIVMHQGILPHAIRSSMSIPSYFTPFEQDDMILVDGGVINNFPVKEVKDMGADIIIGVDVQGSLHQRDDLNSMVKIMEQVVSFYREGTNRSAIELTDIYIHPQLFSYDMMSFDDHDSIVNRGEDATRQLLPQLKKLADSLNQFEARPQRTLEARPLDSVFVVSVVYKGLLDETRSYLVGVLDITPRSYIHLNELEKSILRAYGSNFFEYIRYHLEPVEEGANLVIDAREASMGMLGAGVNYDSDFKVSLLMNASFKNLFFKGTKLYLDLSLGENPFLKGTYLVDRGNRPGFGFSFLGLRLDFNEYYGKRIMESYRALHYQTDAFLYFNLHNTMEVKTGLEFEYGRIRTEINESDFGSFASYLNFFAEWSMDTYNRPTFPTRGILFNLKGKYVTTISDNWANELFSNALIFLMRYEHSIEINERNTIRPAFNLGFTLNDRVPAPQHWFILGGQTNKSWFDGFFPFSGLRFIEHTGHYTATGRLAWQYKLYPRLYLTPTLDMGYISATVEQLVQEPKLLVGFGLTIGYDSFIGPIELSLMGSNTNNGILNFINIGYSW